MAEAIFFLVVLIFSAVIHEVSHGYAAERLGDPTARLAGRLTLNPIPHLSIFGSFILPIITYYAWHIPVGAAKPVPYNPANLKNPLRDGALIAVAGPASNFLIAAVLGMVIRGASFVFEGSFGTGTLPLFIALLDVVVRVNILLAIFNLIPIPPLDGSKAVHLLFSPRMRVAWDEFWRTVGEWIARNRILALIIFFLSFRYVFAMIWIVLSPIVNFLHIAFVGAPQGF